MKRILLIALIAATLPCGFVLADGTETASQELKALVTKVRDDIKAGKTTEAALSDDLQQFDALLAEHKGEKTDAVAGILYMKAILYSEVIHDTAKGDALINQLTND